MSTVHVVVTHGWAGRREVPVRIVGETPKRYKVELLESALIGRRQRSAGSVVYAPKQSVREACPPARGNSGPVNGVRSA